MIGFGDERARSWLSCNNFNGQKCIFYRWVVTKRDAAVEMGSYRRRIYTVNSELLTGTWCNDGYWAIVATRPCGDDVQGLTLSGVAYAWCIPTGDSIIVTTPIDRSVV